MRRLRALWATLREVAGWLRERRLLWLAPLILLLLLFAGVLAVSAAYPAVTPFVYLLF